MRKNLKDLAFAVVEAIRAIDSAMKMPESHDRGRRIAAITNKLEFINDRMLHLKLGYSFKKISNLKKEQ